MILFFQNMYNKFWLSNNMNFQNNFINNNNIDNNLNLIYPHKSGLHNIGQTCYMNDTIKCLSNIKIITDYFIRNFGTFDVQRQTLTVSYSNILFQLFMTKEKYIAPKEFKNTIGELNPLFKGLHAADSKDLVFFLIERLHQENNMMKNNIIIFKTQNQIEQESTFENLMIENFRNDFN